jgi:hypothetical protein
MGSWMAFGAEDFDKLFHSSSVASATPPLAPSLRADHTLGTAAGSTAGKLHNSKPPAFNPCMLLDAVLLLCTSL